MAAGDGREKASLSQSLSGSGGNQELTVSSVIYIVQMPTDGDSVTIHIFRVGNESDVAFSRLLSSFCAQPPALT
jgi:hypothetical protein